MKKFTIIWQPLERTSTECTTVRASSVSDAWVQARDVVPEDARILEVYQA